MRKADVHGAQNTYVVRGLAPLSVRNLNLTWGVRPGASGTLLTLNPSEGLVLR